MTTEIQQEIEQLRAQKARYAMIAELQGMSQFQALQDQLALEIGSKQNEIVSKAQQTAFRPFESVDKAVAFAHEMAGLGKEIAVLTYAGRMPAYRAADIQGLDDQIQKLLEREAAGGEASDSKDEELI